MQYTNNFNLPSAFFDIVNKLTYDVSDTDPKRIGVTTLISPPRIRLLTVRHWNELSEDISKHLWRLLGLAIHYVMSHIDDTHRLIEEKIEENVDGITLVAKPDLYDDKEKSISDFKITSVWSVKIELKDEWINQIQCYCYFLRKAGFEVNKAYINAILKDWRRGESLKYPDYPPIPFQKIDIPLWSIEEQEKYIKNRIKEYKVALQLSDDELPVCSAKERWRKGEEYAVYKGENKKALRVLETEEEAKKYILELGDTKNSYCIKKREGVDLRCTEYCVANKVCSYYQQIYKKEIKNNGSF